MSAALAMQCEVIPVTPLQQNCSLIWDPTSRHGALVDPGGEPERLLEAARRRDVSIDKLLVTHGHLDHAGAVADLAERLGVPIEGPQREDQFWIEQLPAAGRAFGFPPLRSFEPDRWLEHGDRVQLGSLTLEVLHCPGHTPGHVVFYDPVGRVAWVGDVLFKGSIGRTDFPRGNHADLISSIRNRVFPLGDDVRFVPGHGPLSSFGNERRSNPYVSDRALGIG